MKAEHLGRCKELVAAYVLFTYSGSMSRLTRVWLQRFIYLLSFIGMAAH